MEWQAVAASVQGKSHIDDGKPCQDSSIFEILANGQVVIGAVSDGMGSAKHSDKGSQLAVEVAISQLKKHDWLSQKPIDKNQAGEFFRELLETVKTALKNQSETKGYALKDFNCTLLVFVATPSWLTAMQVGDGILVVKSSNGDYQLVFKPDKGEYTNVTTPVTSSNALSKMQVDVKLGNYNFICAATDGIENLSLVHAEDDKPYEGFFKPLEQYMVSEATPDTQEIESFLKSEKINNKRFYDDKTLLLCVFKELRNTQTKGVNQQANSLKSAKTDNLKAGDRRTNGSLSIPALPVDQPEHYEKIKQNIEAIKAYILKEPASQGATPKFKIKKNGYLEVLLLSDQALKQEPLIEGIHDTILNLKISVKGVRIFNASNLHWYEEFNINRSPKWLMALSMATFMAGLLTLIYLLLQTAIPGLMGAIAYFSFALISLYILIFSVKKD